MKTHRRHRFPRRSTCGWCGSSLDLGGTYWVDSREMLAEDIAVGLAHPDCLYHFIFIGPVPRGAWLEHTCGEVACVNPDHFVLHPAP